MSALRGGLVCNQEVSYYSFEERRMRPLSFRNIYFADFIMTEQELAPGRYRHYKGGEYEVIGIARHSERAEELVVYRCLYDNNSLWVRPLPMFCEKVFYGGRWGPRFFRIDATEQAKTLAGHS
jgi:hypothetical protein